MYCLLVYLNADISDELNIFEAVGVLCVAPLNGYFWSLSLRPGSAMGSTDPKSLISIIRDWHLQDFHAILKFIAGCSLILDLHYVPLEQKYCVHPEWE